MIECSGQRGQRILIVPRCALCLPNAWLSGQRGSVLCQERPADGHHYALSMAVTRHVIQQCQHLQPRPSKLTWRANNGAFSCFVVRAD